MKITEEEIRHVARLARLSLKDEDVLTFTRQVDEVLSYMEVLNSLDTTGVPVFRVPTLAENVFRADAPAPGLSNEEALANAPEKDGNDFLVPKVI
ncbi:MAG: Asp-tRNA(Asn)/Glu-tRNA(Gln) amidotransferase subunit GatC [Thermodesulfobacteriota bacterium]